MIEEQDVIIEEYEDYIIAYLNGTISIKNIKDVDTVLNRALDNKPEILGINCKYLTHIDSITINHLLKLSKKALDLNVKLVIFNLSSAIESVVNTINLNRLVTITTKEIFEDEYLSKKIDER